jgi:hypothetical protein
MTSMISKLAIICATGAVLAVVPYSVRFSQQTGMTVAPDQAQAIIGRPATPGSVAGVARRTTRRHAYGAYGYYGPRHCVWVVVNGARVCR